jgi:hypothetical protein
MSPALFVDWQLSRLGRSGTVAVAGSMALAVALVWLSIGNSERRFMLQQSGAATPVMEPFPAAAPQDIPAWRERLAVEEGRLPERQQVIPLVRSAVGSIESSGVTIEALGSASSKVAGLPYELVTLDARLSGSASRSAKAVSQVLATSPGWALESLVIERRPAGQVAVEATFTLLAREAR